MLIYKFVSDFTDNGGMIACKTHATWKTKVNKRGNMTYEGDVDYEILINDKASDERQDVSEGEHTLDCISFLWCFSFQ